MATYLWRAEVTMCQISIEHTQSRAGLGSFPTPQVNNSVKEGWHLVLEGVRAAVGMKQQGAWTRKENVVESKVTCAELWKAEPHSIKYIMCFQDHQTCTHGA